MHQTSVKSFRLLWCRLIVPVSKVIAQIGVTSGKLIQTEFDSMNPPATKRTFPPFPLLFWHLLPFGTSSFPLAPFGSVSFLMPKWQFGLNAWPNQWTSKIWFAIAMVELMNIETQRLRWLNPVGTRIVIGNMAHSNDCAAGPVEEGNLRVGKLFLVRPLTFAFHDKTLLLV